MHVIVAYRADHLAAQYQAVAAKDSPDDLAKFNQQIQQGNEILTTWAVGTGGKTIATMGDGARLEVDGSRLEELPGIVAKYEQETGTTLSVGVGRKLSEAEVALEYSIETGGNSIELFSEELEHDLADLREPGHENKLFASYLDKAENQERSGLYQGAGAGMQPVEHPEEPLAPDQTPQEEVGKQFETLANDSEQHQQQKQQNMPQEQNQSDSLRQSVVGVLQEFKAQAPLWGQLKESQPDAYKTLTDLMQAMVALAREIYSQPVQKNEDAVFDGLDKAEPGMGLHSTVDGFMGQLKGLPKVGPERGKLITQHMNHGPFLSALQAHPQGKQIHSTLTGFLNSKVNAGPGVAARVVAKTDLMPGGKADNKPDSDFDSAKLKAGAKEEQEEHGLDVQRAKEIAKDHLVEKPGYYKKGLAGLRKKAGLREKAKMTKTIHHALVSGKTGRHQVNLPVGSQLDTGPSGTRNAGKLKIQIPGGKTKWRSMRAGKVMAEDGTATSSRHPNPNDSSQS